MAELVHDCPRCDAREITFDVFSDYVVEVRYEWQRWFEVFCVCRRCHTSTVFLCSEKVPDIERTRPVLARIKEGTLNDVVRVERHISLRDAAAEPPPEHLPENVKAAFNEAAKCFAVGCYNAAGVMFRLCLDLATAPLLPAEGDGLDAKVRRDLGRRLPWMFDHELLPEDLRGLSACVKDDGNDAAHRGTLGKTDTEDLQDFTFELLERLFTGPARLEEAKERRKQRRAKRA